MAFTGSSMACSARRGVNARRRFAGRRLTQRRQGPKAQRMRHLILDALTLKLCAEFLPLTSKSSDRPQRPNAPMARQRPFFYFGHRSEVQQRKDGNGASRQRHEFHRKARAAFVNKRDRADVVPCWATRDTLKLSCSRARKIACCSDETSGN
jgi:hypothetical protein